MAAPPDAGDLHAQVTTLLQEATARRPLVNVSHAVMRASVY